VYSKIIIKRKDSSYGFVLLWAVIAIIKKNKNQNIIKLVGTISSVLVFLISIFVFF